eukprot:1157574-Pelagomonas_calceolata.AAC.3
MVMCTAAFLLSSQDPPPLLAASQQSSSVYNNPTPQRVAWHANRRTSTQNLEQSRYHGSEHSAGNMDGI